MTALIIIGVLLLIIILLLLLPCTAYLSFDQEFSLIIKYAGIKVYPLKHEEVTQPETSEPETDKDEEKLDESTFSQLKKKLGFTGAVKEIFLLITDVYRILRDKLKHVKAKKLRLDLIVASENATTTAIEYGVVCSVVYPVLSYLTSSMNIKIKQINIKSDFDSNKPEFSFSVLIRLSVINLITTLFSVFSEYKNFRLRNELK